MSVFMEFLIFVLCPFIIVGYIIYHRERVRRQNLVKNGEKHRFKYLDTFYYSSGNGDGTSDFIIYHIMLNLILFEARNHIQKYKIIGKHQQLLEV